MTATTWLTLGGGAPNTLRNLSGLRGYTVVGCAGPPSRDRCAEQPLMEPREMGPRGFAPAGCLHAIG
jgi:hypothetical protein